MSSDVILANNSIHTSKELDFVSAGTVISACVYEEMKERACVSFRTQTFPERDTEQHKPCKTEG
jgi:hypothetical protein